MKKTATPAAPPDKDNHPFRAIRRAGVPIVAYETADPAATIAACKRALNGKPVPCISYDSNEGIRIIKTGKPEADDRAKEIKDGLGTRDETLNFNYVMSKLLATPPQDCVFFIHAGHKLIEDWTAAQAIWNLRDTFKSIQSTIVLLGPTVKLPPELSNDAPTFEEPVPTEADIERLIDSVMADAKGEAPTGEPRARIIDTVTGYQSAFAIEQSLALGLERNGTVMQFNQKRLWELKVASLKHTAGLEISQPACTFNDLAGCHGAKDLLRKLINGRERFKGVFFLDELEKMVAGGSGDMSGTSQAMIEQFLAWTEDNKVQAVLFIGVPGAGKSQSAKCLAGESRVPLLKGSLSTVKGSLVGQSEQQMRAMLRAVNSVTSGKTLMVATCNSFESLTPEIMGRFKSAIMFYDYPTDEEAKACWQLYMDKYELTGQKIPLSKNWVGREIEGCCYKAWNWNCTLAEAALTVVPVCRSNGTKMENLRQSVSGRFLSAAKVGIYKHDEQPEATAPAGRRFE